MGSKTVRMVFNSIKDNDCWVNLAYELRFEMFKSVNSDMDMDELLDKFYNEEVCKYFKYGEYGNFEIIVDEDFNIVGGRIIY